MPYSRRLELQPGVNVMDLAGYDFPLQALVVRSVVECIHRHERNTLSVVPEAWKFAPKQHGSPVRLAAEELIREGSALKNFIWLNSLPSYEAVLVRVNGIVSVQTFESLWQFPARDEKAATGEDVKVFQDCVCVPGPSPHRLQWVRAKGMLRHPWTGNLLSINTVGGVLDCSPNHAIKKQVSYGPGKVGYEYVPAGSLRAGQHLTSRAFCEESGHRRLAERKGCPELFIGSTELAWFYGFLAAEGWIHRNLVAVCNSDRKLLDRAARVLRDIFHFSPCFNSPRKGVTEVDVRCQRLADHLRHLCYLPGSRPGSRTKTVPVAVLNGPQEIREAWLVS